MKRLIIMIVLIILVSMGAFAQDQQVTKEQQIKDVALDYVILSNDLQKQLNELKTLAGRFADDMAKIQTIAQHDSILAVYGIAKKSAIESDVKKDVKETKK